MPKYASSEKKKSWWRKQGSDLKNIATGAPGAMYGTLKALDQALPESPFKGLERSAFEREGRHNDPTALKAQGVAQLDAIKMLGDKEAWKNDTALNLITALGLAASVTGAGGIAATATRTARGAVPKKPPTRTISAKPKNADEAEKWAKARGLDPSRVSKNTTFKVEVPAAKPLTTRAAQKGADKVRASVPGWQRKKVGAHIRAEKDILDRLDEPTQGGIGEALNKLKAGDFSRDKNLRALVREGNAGLRGLTLYRPGYIGPNLLGANAANLIQMGAKYPGMVKYGRKTTKELGEISPKAVPRMRNMTGSGISQAAIDVGLEKNGPDAPNPQGPIATFMSGVGETLGKATDRRSRDRAFLFEAKKQGYDSAEKLADLLDPEKVFENPALRRDLIQIVKRTEPAAIKFSRTTGGNKLDRVAAENVFLYKWLTGSARYTGHVAGQHPTLTAALANLPEGEDVSEAMGVAVPEFMKSHIPFGMGEEFPQVVNPQSLSLWETLPEAAEVLGNIGKGDIRQAIRILAPVQRAGALAATGYDTVSGKELSEFDWRTGKDRISDRGTASQTERLLWALNETAKMIPYSKLSKRFRSGLYPSTTNEELMRIFSPLGGMYRRSVDPKVAAFIADAEGKEAKGKKKSKSRW